MVNSGERSGWRRDEWVKDTRERETVRVRESERVRMG